MESSRTFHFRNIGLAMMLGAALWALDTTSFTQSASVASGTIVDLKSNWGDETVPFPVVSFRTPAGEEHAFRNALPIFGYQVGDRVEVLYAPRNPKDARIRSFGWRWVGPIAVGGFGTAFLLLGIGPTLAHLMSRKRAQELRRRGSPVPTTFQNVEQNTSLKGVSGQSPWRIVAQWEDPSTGLLHSFRSENVWSDPTPHLQGREITVYVDRRNPKRYYMDISFLPTPPRSSWFRRS